MTTITPVIFYVGDIWEPVTVTTDPKTGSKVDPSTVKILVTKPSLAAEAEATMTKTGVGEYTARVELTEAGKWRADILCTGTYKGVRPESITVQPD